jgi:hypothetical protein
MSKEQLNEKAEGIVKNFLATKFVSNVVLTAKTVRTLVLIVVPTGIAYYLVTTQEDRLVLGLAVAIAIFGAINLVKTAYRAEIKSSKRR